MGIRFDPDHPTGGTEPGFIARTLLRFRGSPAVPGPPHRLRPSVPEPEYGMPPMSDVEVGARGGLTADEVAAVRFSPSRYREGYDQGEVDDFLDRVQSALRDRAAGRPPALTGADVINTRFQATRFRAGYDQDEVDTFLDRITEALA